MPWLDEVDAILWAGLPGPGGRPRGRRRAAQRRSSRPAGWSRRSRPPTGPPRPGTSSPTDGALPYDEGTFVGYRGHAARRAPGAGVLVRPRAGLRRLVVRRRRPLADRTVSVEVTNTVGRDSPRGRAGLPRSRSATTSRCAWSAGPAVDVPAGAVGHRSGRRVTADVADLGHRRRRLADRSTAASCWWPAASATCAIGWRMPHDRDRDGRLASALKGSSRRARGGTRWRSVIRPLSSADGARPVKDVAARRASPSAPSPTC